MVKRGEIWWASIARPVGSGPGMRRPVVIVQSDDFNRSRIRTVIALALTSNLALAEAPGNVLLPARLTRLPKDLVANVSQVITLDKSMLAGRAGKVAERVMATIDAGLRLVLEL
ncbi:MAG: type II toxin-antitoxin system PemK/MazF family toxin [Polyangiaceae bacterium]